MVSCEREINHQGWELSVFYRESSLVGVSGEGCWKNQATTPHDPLQYPCLGNPMDGGAWRATVHEVAKKVRHDLATKQQQRTK